MKTFFSILFISLYSYSFCQTTFGGDGPLVKNRVYTELGLETYSTQIGLSVGPRWKLGGNVYFLDRYIYALGVNFNIASISIGLSPNPSFQLVLPGAGPSLIVRTGDEHGLEFNLPFGYGLYSNETIVGGGLYYTFDAKWRNKDWAFGIAYNGFFNADKNNRDYFDSFALTACWQFSIERFANMSRNFGGIIMM
ncbi:MAG: hypothetical protein ACPGU5_05365 [Lishizhenia sp.]